MSRLRRALPEGRLVTRPPGYLFRAVPDEVDVSRFERLLAQGRQALADGAAAEAADLLAEALALWRGRRWPTSATSRSLRPRSPGWRSCGWSAWRSGSRPTWPSAPGPSWSASSSASSASSPCASGSAASSCWPCTAAAARPTPLRRTARRGAAAGRARPGAGPGPGRAGGRDPAPRPGPADGTAPAPPAAVPVRKPVTVLCAELEVASGSGAGLDPEALRAVLERAQAVLGANLERHGGRLSAAVGRRIVGVFGVLTLHEDDALRAAQAALAAKGRWRPRRPSWRSAGWPCRCGSAWPPARRWSAAPSRRASPATPSAWPTSWPSGRRPARSWSAARPAAWPRPRWRSSRPATTSSGCWRPIGARPLAVRLDAPLVGRDWAGCAAGWPGDLGRPAGAGHRARRGRHRQDPARARAGRPGRRRGDGPDRPVPPLWRRHHLLAPARAGRPGRRAAGVAAGAGGAAGRRARRRPGRRLAGRGAQPGGPGTAGGWWDGGSRGPPGWTPGGGPR